MPFIVSSSSAAVKRTERLTERERDILKWISRGKSAWQIGCFLHIQPRIVEWHIEQACERLGVADKFEAIMKVSLQDLSSGDFPQLPGLFSLSRDVRDNNRPKIAELG